MRVPFTAKQFLDVFRRYNESVWPAQWALLALALLALLLAARARPGGSDGAARAVAVLLALLWAWMGVAYHFAFFRAINPAATLFAAAFVVQAAIFASLMVRRTITGLRPRRTATGVLGGAIVAYALVGYPVLGFALGHRYPAAPTFGLPCPTTIFTLGLLLWAEPPLPRYVYAIPLLWAVIGTTAALGLGMPEDFGLAIAAAVVGGVAVSRRWVRWSDGSSARPGAQRLGVAGARQR